MGAQRNSPHPHAGQRVKVALAGRVAGTVNGAPFTARAEGHEIQLATGLSLAGAKCLWRTRRGLAQLSTRRPLGIRVSAKIAGIPIGVLSI